MQLGNLATGVILARGLGPAERGEVAALIALVISVTVLSGFSFADALVYWLSRTKPAYARHAGSGLLVALSCGVVGSLVLLTLSPIMTHISGSSVGALWPWFLYPIGFQLALGCTSLARGVDLHGRWTFLRMSTTVNYAVLLAYFVFLHQLAPTQIGIAALGGQLLSIVFAIALLQNPLRQSLADWSAVRAIMTYAVKLHPSSFSSIAREQLDKIILFYLVPSADLGRYVVGIALGLVPVAVAGTIDQVLFPSLVSIADPTIRKRACLMQVRIMGALLLSGLTLSIPLTPLAVRFLFGREYLAAEGIPMAAVAIGFLQSLKTVFNIGLKIEHRPGALSLNEMIGIGVTFTLLLPLVWWLGIYGAPLASGIGGSIAISLTIRNIARIYNVPTRLVMIPRRGDLKIFIDRLRTIE